MSDLVQVVTEEECKLLCTEQIEIGLQYVKVNPVTSECDCSKSVKELQDQLADCTKTIDELSKQASNPTFTTILRGKICKRRFHFNPHWSPKL